MGHYLCDNCGAVGIEAIIPVWENPEDYNEGVEPDYIGCTECGTMNPNKRQ